MARMKTKRHGKKLRTKAKRRGKKSKKHPPSPTMLLSKMLPKDLMRSAVLGFLDRASVVSFMAAKEFSDVFRLTSCFCQDHGTRLVGQQVCVPTGTAPKKQCVDCEMAKIEKIRCRCCDDFSKWDDFLSCKICEKSECYGCTDIADCAECNEQFCYDCKLSFFCGVCCMEFCDECNPDWLPCCQCDKNFCLDCKDMFICEGCDEPFCYDCTDMLACCRCSKPFCNDCKEMSTWTCDGCEHSFCVGCALMH
jgi:hypothetical protein